MPPEPESTPSGSLRRTADKVQEDLQRGAVFYDLHRSAPALLNVFSGEVRDGRGHILHKRLFVTQTNRDGTITVWNSAGVS